MESVLLHRTEIPRPRDEVFDFFSRAENLERLTPANLRFRILTPLPIEMREGALIDYRLRLNGIPLKWRTLISTWDPPNVFVDTQLKGPYRQWIHTHRFTELESGSTLMEDEVRYRLPFGPLGMIALPIVRRQVRGIFEYREKALADALNLNPG